MWDSLTPLFTMIFKTWCGSDQLGDCDAAVMYLLLIMIVSCTLATCGGKSNVTEWDTGSHEVIVAKYFQNRQFSRTSNLGAILFKEEVPNLTLRRKKFLVYIHKTSDLSLGLHSGNYNNVTTSKGSGFLEGCSVTNCEFTEDPEILVMAEAVLVVLVRGRTDIPRPEAPVARTPRQLWVFMATNSPPYTVDSDKIGELANIFNWSMTYRTESDVPIPFGRTVPLAAPVPDSVPLSTLVPHWGEKQRHVLAAALLSNCRAQPRHNYLNNLKLYMRVHYYGSCYYRKPNDQCSKTGECKSLNRYLFYLAFENAECSEFLTERVFEQALVRGAIPVVLGASAGECARLLPPGSFLHARDYATHRDLARHLQALAASDAALLRYHAWRRHFEVRSERAWWGERGSRLCRLCEALNYNGRARRRYSEHDLRRLLDPSVNCQNLP